MKYDELSWTSSSVGPAAPGTLPCCWNGWAMRKTPPTAATMAAAVMALTGLSMDWVLPMTVGV